MAPITCTGIIPTGSSISKRSINGYEESANAEPIEPTIKLSNGRIHWHAAVVETSDANKPSIKKST